MGEWKNIFIIFNWFSGLLHDPVALSPGKNLRCPLNSNLDVAQNRFGRCRELNHGPAAHGSSLYRLSYRDSHNRWIGITVISDGSERVTSGSNSYDLNQGPLLRIPVGTWNTVTQIFRTFSSTRILKQATALSVLLKFTESGHPHIYLKTKQTFQWFPQCFSYEGKYKEEIFN
jgi:hypothetical protein